MKKTKNIAASPKKTKPLRAGFVIASLTFLSRVFGLLRDIVLAANFGGSYVLDAFLVAFRVPNFFRRLFAEGAFNQSFIPILVEFESEGDRKRLKEFSSQVLGLMIAFLGLLSVLGVVFSDYLTLVFAAGFRDDAVKFSLTSAMLKITFPYLLLIAVTAYFMALQNSINRFALAAFTPVLLNISLIAAVLLFAPLLEMPIMAAAWGLLAAGFLQLIIQIPALRSYHILHPPKFKLKLAPSVKRLLRIMTPIMLSGSIVQINLIVDMLLASFLVTGSIAWLAFAERLIQLPLGIFGIALTTVMMPYLSRLQRTSSPRAIGFFTSWSIRVALMISLPATLGLIIMAEPLIASIFFYGSFSAEDVANTQQALRAYALGLSGFILIKVLSSVFFARQDTKTPLKVVVVGAIIGICCSLTLVWSLKHVGIALATSISASFSATVLGILIYKQGTIKLGAGTGIFLLRLTLALTAMVSFLLYATPYFQLGGSDWLAMPPLTRIINLSMIIPGGVVVYFLSLFAMGMKWRHINIKYR